MSVRPTFLGINTMSTAISAAQKALDITGNNIANVDSLGYTRQRLDLVSVANASNGVGYTTSVGLAGQGVKATGVTQLRDAALDKRFRELNADSAESATESAILTDIEDVIDIVDTDGFNQSYTNFKTALSSLSADADNSSLSKIALTSAEQLVQSIRSYNTKLVQIEDQTKFETETAVSRVNQILNQIADLNDQIANEYVASGDIFMDGNTYTVNAVYGPLELKDSRNALLDELSNYGNIEVSDNDNGSVNVKFANTTVVDDKKYSTLVLDEHSTGTLSLHFENQAGNATEISVGTDSLDSGALKGYLDMYNGAGFYSDDIAIRQDGVKTTADEVNDILKDISDATDLATNATARSEFQTALQKYDSSFAIDADGKVTFGPTATAITVISADSAATAVFNKLSVTIDDTNTAISYKIGDTAIGTTGLPLAGGTDAEKSMDTKLTEANDESTFSDVEGIVYYRKVIDALANTVATAFNNANSDTTMVNANTNEIYIREMFNSSDGGVIDASNIQVAQDWTDDPSLITQGIKAVYGDTSDPTLITGIESYTEETEELSSTHVNKLQAVVKKELEFTIDGNNIGDNYDNIDQTLTIDKYIEFWSNNLGQEIEYQDSVNSSADTMASNVAASRDAISGINIDEEGVNMLTFQKWFNASSRMLTTMDEALDTIINSMGLVGR